jgi:hypothetical protein
MVWNRGVILDLGRADRLFKEVEVEASLRESL